MTAISLDFGIPFTISLIISVLVFFYFKKKYSIQKAILYSIGIFILLTLCLSFLMMLIFS